MPDKPTTAAGYAPDQIARVRATCLYLATKLGDLMPELVVVGGLVPSLLIDQQNLPENVTPHVGTLDLDLGLAFAWWVSNATKPWRNGCARPDSRWT